jgi:hypothetical protein
MDRDVLCIGCTMKRPLLIVLVVFALTSIAASCEKKPPYDGGAGGAYTTGGSPATGGNVSSGGTTEFAGQSSTGGGITTGGTTAVPSTFSKCQQACAQYVRFGCPEEPASCEQLCILHTTDVRFSPSPAAAEKYVSCRINATSKAQLRNCGLASCR